MNPLRKSQDPTRILVVDDDKQVASALSIRLQATGYDVVTASDGPKGLAAALDAPPDLIVMDIWLPGGPGFAIARLLKNVGLGRIPIIFMTASKKEGLWKLAQEVGSTAFIEKPYDPEELLATIAREMDDDPEGTCTSTLSNLRHQGNSNGKNINH